MRLLDLFAGIGGFSLAAHWMGWETVAFVEKEPFCQKVLAKNFLGVEIYDDITTFSGKPFRGRVDIITGGFPCQPFSAAGKRKGRDDERHLFPEMLRVISEVRPRWVVAENVRGLLGIESGKVFADVISSLEGEGYEVITFCIPASAVEAPHRRDRLWIIAHDTTNTVPQRLQGQASGVKRREEYIRYDRDIVRDGSKSSHRADSNAPNTSFTRLQGGELNGAFSEGTRSSRSASERHSDASNAESTDRGGLPLGETAEYAVSRHASHGNWRESWYDVAVRTCVRRMDDELPDELDIVGSRDNRAARLKALGNAIVPTVALEIFRAIEEAER